MRTWPRRHDEEVVTQQFPVVVSSSPGGKTDSTKDPQKDVVDVATQISCHVSMAKLVTQHGKQEDKLVATGLQKPPQDYLEAQLISNPENLSQLVSEEEWHKIGHPN
mmetsp:Transcript_157470/g.293735  ORF Transcript_157470/g.293735 Transcript_157470/m.293735 type:complete len:107 (+) Transcript_157470:134-454(+)